MVSIRYSNVFCYWFIMYATLINAQENDITTEPTNSFNTNTENENFETTEFNMPVTTPPDAGFETTVDSTDRESELGNEDDEDTNESGQSFKNDKFLTTPQLVAKYGYPVEEHFVITEDGYNLTMFRIPRQGPPIFLMHGLLLSSDDFLTAGPNNGLAYYLYNASYDIWLGNARGNKYSRRHVRLSPDKDTFWKFSWNEIGYYDMPAMLDYTLMMTNKTRLIYIGHSQGTTVFYVLMSLRPEYNAKIQLSISLATVAWVWHVKAQLLLSMVPFRNQENALAFSLNHGEVLSNSSSIAFVTSRICPLSRVLLFTCIVAIFSLIGYDSQQIDYNHLPVEIAHFPSGSSITQLTHYFQLADSRRFAQYDYGREENLKLYETPEPPSYPVQKVTAPVVIFYADNDFISVFDDVQILINRLPRVVGVYRVPHEKFNHYDYHWAKNAKQLLYFSILRVMRSFTMN